MKILKLFSALCLLFSLQNKLQAQDGGGTPSLKRYIGVWSGTINSKSGVSPVSLVIKETGENEYVGYYTNYTRDGHPRGKGSVTVSPEGECYQAIVSGVSMMPGGLTAQLCDSGNGKLTMSSMLGSGVSTLNRAGNVINFNFQAPLGNASGTLKRYKKAGKKKPARRKAPAEDSNE
ncbi:MAG: hypothetical protein NTX59_12670 [Elusimicrobia bacterium]|nr:hypothetical protein [Elusimicrobiota bacterium]